MSRPDPAALTLYEPQLRELGFRRDLLADPDTMSYNRAWGGVIPFPESAWPGWYDRWVARPRGLRFYRYLRLGEAGDFVGEAAYHFDPARSIWLADVIVAAACRGRGYGARGLALLCEAAAARGIRVLRDEIAADNPALALFLRAGFTEEARTAEAVMVKKDLIFG